MTPYAWLGCAILIACLASTARVQAQTNPNGIPATKDDSPTKPTAPSPRVAVVGPTEVLSLEGKLDRLQASMNRLTKKVDEETAWSVKDLA
jgi:hypothetical protein